MSALSPSLSDSFDFSSISGGALAARGGRWLERVNKPGDGRLASPRSGRRMLSSPPPAAPLPPPVPLPRYAAPMAISPVTFTRGFHSIEHGDIVGSEGRRRSSTAPRNPSNSRTDSRSPHTPSFNYGRHGPREGNTSSMYSSPNGRSLSASRLPVDLTAVGSPIPINTDDSDTTVGALVSQLRQTKEDAWGSVMSPASYPARTSPDDRARGSPPYPTPHPYPFGNDSSSVTAKPVQASSSAYTSAIIQALSLSEGAAMANTTQQTLSSLPLYGTLSGDGGYGQSESDGSDHEEDDEKQATGSRGKDLYDQGMRVKVAKQQWMSLEKARQEILENARLERDCPFQPRVSPFAAKIQRPPTLRPENRAHGEMLRKKQWINMKKQAEVEKAMEECTFRPLTLRTARFEKDGNPRSSSQVFSELYHDAEERKYFENAVQPQIVDVMERHVVGQGSSGPVLSQDEIKGVVERLFTKAIVVADSGADGKASVRRSDSTGTTPGPPVIRVAIPDETFKPELSKATKKIMEEKLKNGERDSDVVNDLYGRNEIAQLERRLEQTLRAEEDRQARLLAAAKREEARERLELERFRTVLSAKYRALGKCVWRAGNNDKTAFRPRGPHSVVALARASLDVLSSEETEELLAAFENCGVDRVTESEFVFLVLQHVTKNTGGGHSEKAHDPNAAAVGNAVSWRENPLFLVPPPPPPSVTRASSTVGRRDSVHADPIALVPPPLPRVKREKADPAVLENLRRKREEQMLEWREEARQRAELAELGDPNYKPAPRRLIPYECRPDVHVPIRTNRAARLRETRAKEQQHGVGEQADRKASALAIESESHARVQPLSQDEAQTARSLFPRAKSTNAAARQQSRQLSRSSYANEQARQRRSAARGSAPGRRGLSAPPPLPTAAGADSGSTPQLIIRAQSPPQHPMRQPGKSVPPLETLRAPPSSSLPARTSQSVVPSPAPVPAPTPLPAPAKPARNPGAWSGSKDCVYQGVIAEHAAFGGEEALVQLGRELLLKQLQDYQKKHQQK